MSLPRSPLPIFPLPGVCLFPHQVLPLHVFEPRYRQLVGDLLDGPGRFVLGTIDPTATGREPAPPLLPIAGLGEIVRHEKLPDGRYHIWVMGLCRVQITEVPSDRLYRQVAVAPFAEIDVDEAAARDLSRALHAAATARLSVPLPLAEATPPALLADLLAQTLRPDPALLARYFGEPSVAERARLVLAEAKDQPPPPSPSPRDDRPE